MTIFTIIRHGTTVGIEKGKLQGLTDSPLSQRGVQQARMTAQFLSSRHIRTCYCSPLGRARETAAIICEPLGLQPVILEDLREYDFGWLEGHRYFRPPHDHSSIFIKLKSLARLTLAGMTGESMAQIRQRAVKVWQYLMDQQLEGENLVISHGFFINVFIQEILKVSGQPKTGIFDVSTCSLTTLGLEKRQPTLLDVNNSDHLARMKFNAN